MCSIQGEDIEELNLTGCSGGSFENEKIIVTDVCRKCSEPPVVILRKKDRMCKQCFIAYIYHKFRSVIGKSKKIKPGSKVLVAHSGGPHSSAMLHMVKQALDEACHKKLIFTPGLLHIDESVITSGQFDEKLDFIAKQSASTGYPAIYSSLEMALREDDTDDFYFKSITKLKESSCIYLRDKLNKCLRNIQSLTYRQEYVEYMRTQLIKDIARDCGYSHVFVGNSATNIAIKLLSNLAMGRGSQTASNTTFYDDRSRVPICRPMREFLNKEIMHYVQLSYIPYIPHTSMLTKTDVHASIQRLTENFVCTLQENFPATIFTIFRTSNKVSASRSAEENCIMCDSPRDNVQPDPCSALEALSLSARLSLCNDNDSYFENTSPPSADCDIVSIHNYVCHGCSIIVDEMRNSSDFPSAITRKIHSPINRLTMREQIKEYILDEED